MCAPASNPHMCASPRGPACMPPVGVCLGGDLCVDFEDTDACGAHARPVSQNLSSGGPAPGAPIARLLGGARDLDDLAGGGTSQPSPARPTTLGAEGCAEPEGR